MRLIPRTLGVSVAVMLVVANGCGPMEPASRVIDETGVAYRLARLNDLPLPAIFSFPEPKTYYSGDICLFTTGQYRLSTTTDGGAGGSNRTTTESYGMYSLTTPRTFQARRRSRSVPRPTRSPCTTPALRKTGST